MQEKTYFDERSAKSLEKIRKIIDELPYYAEEFFVGIENRTTPLTRLNYAYDLRIFFDFLSKKTFKGKHAAEISLDDLNNLASSDIELFLSYLSRYTVNGKTESCNERGKARKLATIRSFFKYFFNKGSLTANTAAKVSMPKLHDKEIIRLESNGKINEIAAILNTADTGNGLTQKQQQFHKLTRIRDVAILTLFLGTGIRISELVGLDTEDIDFGTNAFVVTRKGGDRKMLYFGMEVKASLEDYAIERNNNPFAADERAFFLSLQNTRISTRTVQELVKKYAKIVSPLKKITPHKLRSTFGTNLYRETHDIYVVAATLGHKDVNTTKKHYADITDDIIKRAVTSVKLRDKDD
ncbi:MAG: integrase [Bacillota bacterium]|nr:MAG: integrase [Bacillota bacterium]